MRWNNAKLGPRKNSIYYRNASIRLRMVRWATKWYKSWPIVLGDHGIQCNQKCKKWGKLIIMMLGVWGRIHHALSLLLKATNTNTPSRKWLGLLCLSWEELEQRRTLWRWLIRICLMGTWLRIIQLIDR